jgi:hypothetical protein
MLDPGGLGSVYIVLRRYRAPKDQTDLNKWFRLILGGGGGSFQKMDRGGAGGRPVGPIIGPVGPRWAPLRLTFDGCVHVVVPFPKSIKSHETESGGGSYARFTKPLSATNIFWFWTLNMENDISVSIISTSSSQCCTLILPLRYF